MKTKRYIILLLASLLLASPSMHCEAAGYQITAAELTRLETNLNQLQKINSRSQLELTTLREQLKEAKQQLSTLNNQLDVLKADSEKQQQLLKTANESLEAYAKEEQAKQSRLKMQRNIAYVIAAGLLYAAVK